MKQFLYISLFLMISIIFSGCPNNEGQEYIYIINKSNTPLGFVFSKDNDDTIFYCYEVSRKIPFCVASDSIFRLEDGDEYSSWDDNMKSFKLFIFDIDLYNKYFLQPCDTVRKYVPILQRYDLTLSDLVRLHWKITYPPTEEMKYIKMWPPYGSSIKYQ